MTSINTNPSAYYSKDNNYDKKSNKLQTNPYLRNGSKAENSENKNNSGGVKVSLSKGAETAKLRESIGLKPTGRLKLGDFERVSDEKEKEISEKVSELMEELGIDKNQKVSISLDSNSKLKIAESFKGKDKLLKALNSDDDFKSDFQKLSTNREVVDFAKKLTTMKPSLTDYLNKDASWDSIMASAKKHTELKTSSNSLGNLLDLSHQETPYTFVHNSDSKS